jgi:uncharacterized protein
MIEMNASVATTTEREEIRGGFLGRHPFALFLTLAFGIPILLVASLLLTPQFWSWVHGGPFDYFAEFERLTRALGLVSLPGSSLYLWVRLSLAEPIFWTGNIYVGAPTIAALIVVGATGANGGLRDFVRRLRLSQGLGAGQTVLWYATAFAVMLVRNLCIPLILGVPLASWQHYAMPSFALVLLAGAFFDQGGLLEEGGWRGFALPYLQRMSNSPLQVNFLLGVIWGLWHVPRDLAQRFTASSGYLLGTLLPFILGCITLSLIIAFFFYRVGGSVWMGVMLHSLSNNNAGIGWDDSLLQQSMARFNWGSFAVELGIVLVIVLIYGKNLGLRRDSTSAPIV